MNMAAGTDAAASTVNESTFAAKLQLQLEKQTSKTPTIDKTVVIKDISPVVDKDGVVNENRTRIVDTNGVLHWCFTNQLASQKLAAGMKVVISYREKGEYINVLRVTPVLESLSAQQLAYLNNNPLVIPAL